MKWLHDLAEYYSHNRDIPEIKIRMLAQAFQDEDPEVMEAAVFQYMQEQRWYPIIADLKPYVDTARLDAQRHPDIYQAHTKKALHIMDKWETCSACGERSPSPGEECPFCRDMASAMSYNVVNGTAVDLEAIRAAAQAAKT